MHAVGVVRF